MSAWRSQLFIGRLPSDCRDQDLEDIFDRYGRLARCEIKYGAGKAYAFVDYEDTRDAEDAIRYENGREVLGQRIVVEWARGPSNRIISGAECYRCHRPGHWIRDCPENDDRGGSYRGRRNFGRYPRSTYPPRYRRSRSRSRSKHARRSHSRDRSPTYRRSSHKKRRRTRSPSTSPPSRSRSRSLDRKQRIRKEKKKPRKSMSRSASPDSKESRSRSHTPPQEPDAARCKTRSRNLEECQRGSSDSRSPSPRNEHGDNKSKESADNPRNRSRSRSRSASYYRRDGHSDSEVDEPDRR